MDLTHATLPGAVGDIHFGIGVMTGKDRIAQILLPESLLLRYVAWRIMGRGVFPEGRRVTFQVHPDPRVWEVKKDLLGKIYVEPWKGGG